MLGLVTPNALHLDLGTRLRFGGCRSGYENDDPVSSRACGGRAQSTVWEVTRGGWGLNASSLDL